MENINRPFEKLSDLLKQKSVVILDRKISPGLPLPSIPAGRFKDDESMFLSEMKDVVPLKNRNIAEKGSGISSELKMYQHMEDEVDFGVRVLENLVSNGSGFDVSFTPEYVYGTGAGVHRIIAERLYKRDFAIQGHIDLHGMGVMEAMSDLDTFIRESISLGKKGLLIVHGRGLSSPDEPVLKTRVIERLTRGKWRRWVLAFSSAPLMDGGGGGTYVLFRERPIPRRQTKGKPIIW